MTASVVSVAELKAAWRDLVAGAYRGASTSPEVTSDEVSLVEDGHGPVILVAGAAGRVGASTVALALAEAAGAQRLVDCAATVNSGLVEVCDRELGLGESGWQQGRRGNLLVERNPHVLPSSPQQVARPAPVVGLSVIDAGWEALVLSQTLAGWLGATLRDPRVPLVLVAVCTVGCLRRLEVALDLLAAPDRDVRVAVTGVHGRRWPRDVAVPPRLRELREAARVACVPPHTALTTRGLTSTPIPAAVAAAAQQLLQKGTRP